MRSAVTGGSGKLGLECVRHLVAEGHAVISLDHVLPRETLGKKAMRVDFLDDGQVLECFTHIEGGWDRPDCVVHLAAIPGPSHAAKAAGMTNAVFAASETMTGVPYDKGPPYLPMDEDTPRRPETDLIPARFDRLPHMAPGNRLGSDRRHCRPPCLRMASARE